MCSCWSRAGGAAARPRPFDFYRLNFYHGSMWYIVGLGNPGKEHVHSRHNAGWMMLDSMVTRFGLPTPIDNRAYSGRVATGTVADQPVTVLYPNTFMNASGSAVKKLVPRGATDTLIVLYDDIDLPLGTVKISLDRGDGGHNGIKSIHEALATKAFIRIRIGIARKNIFGLLKRPKGEALAKFVLNDFTKDEQMELARLAARVGAALETIITDGVAVAMQHYNAPQTEADVVNSIK